MDVFVKLAELCPKLAEFFYVLAGKQFLDLATLPANKKLIKIRTFRKIIYVKLKRATGPKSILGAHKVKTIAKRVLRVE
jgi:hypothetical protein